MNDDTSYLAPSMTRSVQRFGVPPPDDSDDAASLGWAGWFGPLVNDLQGVQTYGIRNSGEEQHIRDLVSTVIDRKVGTFKKRMNVDANRTYVRNSQWVLLVSNLFQMQDKSKDKQTDYNELRLKYAKRPYTLKDIFLLVVSDDSKDLRRARELYFMLTGSEEEDEATAAQNVAMSKTNLGNLNKFMQGSKEATTTTPWTSSMQISNKHLPPTMVNLMHDEADNGNELIEALLELLRRGGTVREFSWEPELYRLIDTGSANPAMQNDYFQSSVMSRPFGPRSLELQPANKTNLRDWCQHFVHIRKILYGEDVVGCKSHEDYKIDDDTTSTLYNHDPLHDDDNIKYSSRRNEQMFMPELPEVELTGMQRDFMYNTICPVLLGSMYPWISRPGEKARNAMLSNIHSGLILSAHGVVDSGREFVSLIVPFFALCVSNFIEASEKAECGLRMEVKLDEDQRWHIIRVLKGVKSDKINEGSMKVIEQLREHDGEGAALFEGEVQIPDGEYENWLKKFNAPNETFEKNGQTSLLLTRSGKKFKQALDTAVFPSFAITQTVSGKGYWLNWIPKWTNGIPCHTAKICRMYNMHDRNQATLYTSLSDHNFRLERREWAIAEKPELNQKYNENDSALWRRHGDMSGFKNQ